MKISLDFGSLADMLVDLPKFAALLSGSGTMEERMIAAGLDADVIARRNQIKVTIIPPPGVKLTEEEKEALKTETTKAIAETLGVSAAGAQIAENVKADTEKLGEAAQTAAEPPKKERAKKNTPAPEKAAKEAQSEPDGAMPEPQGVAVPQAAKVPDVTEIRKVMKACLDAGKRDEAKAILTSVGADNVTTIPKEKRAEVLERMTALAAGKE